MQGTNTGHEDAAGMASVGVRLTDQLGRELAEDDACDIAKKCEVDA